MTASSHVLDNMIEPLALPTTKQHKLSSSTLSTTCHKTQAKNNSRNMASAKNTASEACSPPAASDGPVGATVDCDCGATVGVSVFAVSTAGDDEVFRKLGSSVGAYIGVAGDSVGLTVGAAEDVALDGLATDGRGVEMSVGVGIALSIDGEGGGSAAGAPNGSAAGTLDGVTLETVGSAVGAVVYSKSVGCGLGSAVSSSEGEFEESGVG